MVQQPPNASYTMMPNTAGPNDTQFQQPTNVMFREQGTSKLELGTLPKNTYLYYGSSTVNAFDPNDIKLSENTLLALFSNNPRVASDMFMNCANFPMTNGYLHKFIVKQSIENIQIIDSSSIKKNSNLLNLDMMYCQRQENPKLNGFAYTITDRNLYTCGEKEEGIKDAVIGLCDPNKFLDYESTRVCVNPYKLSTEITFTDKTST